ncbi:MAG: HAD family hydrolase [Gammaproteobacteria bacterium]
MTNAAKSRIPKAILWDLDGVLVRTESLNYLATREVLLNLNLELDRDTYHHLFLQNSQDPLRMAVNRLGLTDSHFNEFHRIRSRKFIDLLATEEIEIEGVSETIHRLANDFVMGIVTGTKREHVDIMKARTDFFHLFDFSVTLYDAPATKPYPEPYLKGVKLSGKNAGECLAVEDSERGLQSAKAAGINCWVIPNNMTQRGDFSTADRILGSISEIADLITHQVN